MLLAFLLTLLAGLSTVIGGLLALHKVMLSRHMMAISLAFAAGAMILVSFVEMLPASQTMVQRSFGDNALWISFVAFFVGMLLVAVIDKLIPAKLNPSEQEGNEIDKKNTFNAHERKQLLRGGVLVAIAIGLHNFPEGLVTFIATLENPSLGVMLAIAIAIHNIPEGIAIAAPLYAATKSRRETILYTLISSFAEPLGALAGYLIIGAFVPENLLGAVFAAVAGMMVFISIDELLPAAKRYETNHHQTVYGCVAGMAVMAASLVLLSL